MKKIKNYIHYLFLKSIIKLIGIIPNSITKLIIKLTANRIFATNHNIYKQTISNVKKCFPEKSSQQQLEFSKKSIRETVSNYFEICKIWSNSHKKNIKKIHKVHNIELLDSAIAFNNGAILIAPHIGTWELIPAHITSNHTLTAMYEKPKKEVLDKILLNSRKIENMRTVPASSKGIIQLVKTLKANKMIAILPDQVPQKLSGGTISSFMGQDALTMNLIYKLIKKTGAKAVACCAIRVNDGFHIHYLSPTEELYSKDEQTSVDALNELVERCVKLAPEQYQWEYNRFKTRDS